MSDKIKVIENLLHHVQMLFIGGGIARTFLKAMGYEIGDYIVRGRKYRSESGNLKGD